MTQQISALLKDVEVGEAKFDDAMKFAKLAAPAWESVAEELGDKALTDPVLIAGLIDKDLREAVKGIKPLQRTQVVIMINYLRKRLGVTVSDFREESTQTAAATPSTTIQELKLPETIKVTTQEQDPDMLKVQEFFDQSSKLSVKRCTDEEIKEYRDKWLRISRIELRAHRRWEDDQISVLRRLRERGHNMLAFDLGILAPFPSRRQRRLALTIHFRTAKGEWRPKVVPWPETAEDWREAFSYGSTGLYYCDAADLGVAKAYRDFVYRMAVRVGPEGFWAVALADWKYRFEISLVLQREQRTSTDPIQPCLTTSQNAHGRACSCAQSMGSTP